jgi:hypothetical protein
MNEDPEKSSSLSAIILTVIIIIVAVYSTTFGTQTLQWIDAHRWAAANPWLRDVPQPVAAASANAAAATSPAMAMMAMKPARAKGAKAPEESNSTTLTAYAYVITVPWTAKNKEKPSPGGAEFRFDSGQVVVFGDPEAQLDTLHILRDTPTSEYAAYSAIFNDGSISTNYALYKAVYGVSPSQISPFMNYNAAQRDRILLLTKLSFGFDLEKPIYSFDFGKIRGFQFGDPATSPVAIRAFNSLDKQFRFIFTVASGSSGQVTQDDINQAMQSLQSVSAEAPEAAK